MKNKKSNGGISFSAVLTTIFVVLKLCNVIEWGWVWVLSPLWIGLTIFIIALVVFLTIESAKKDLNTKDGEDS